MIERDDLARRMASLTVRVELLDPAEQTLVELRLHAHRVIDTLARLEQARQDVVDVGDRKGVVGAVVGDGALGARPAAVPQLLVGVAIAAEHEVFAVGATGYQHGDGVGLGEAGEIVEVAVGSVVVQRVAAAHALGRRGDDGDGAGADELLEVPAPARELGRLQDAASRQCSVARREPALRFSSS